MNWLTFIGIRRWILIYLDTHVVVWLYAGEVERISEPARDLINGNDLLVSPMVILELQYLFEIQRITEKPHDVVSALSRQIGLQVCGKSFHSISAAACDINWTRDPFDRLIVANSLLNQDFLLTKDKTILENHGLARW